MERDPYEGGTDVGRDIARDLGDEPPSAMRDAAPDIPERRSTNSSPVSGHMPRAGEADLARSIHPSTISGSRPGPHLPALPTVGTQGRAIERSTRCAGRGAEPGHAQPLLDEGPCGLPVVYTMAAGGYDVVVNGDHLASWGVSRSSIQDAAMRNLAPGPRPRRGPTRSRATGALWSDTGDGGDARGSCCPRSRAPRGRTRGPPGACSSGCRSGTATRGSLRRRRGVRGAVRGVRPGAIRRGRRDRSTARVRARRRAARRVRGLTRPTADRAAVRVDVERTGRDDHARPTGRAQRADRADEEGAARGVPAGRAGRGRPGRRPHRRRPGVLRRAGPRERLQPDAAPLDVEVRERYNPIIRAMRALEADRRRRSTASRQAPALRSRWPATFGSPRRRRASCWRSGGSGSCPDSGATWFLPRLVGTRGRRAGAPRRPADGGRRRAARPRRPGRAGRRARWPRRGPSPRGCRGLRRGPWR